MNYIEELNRLRSENTRLQDCKVKSEKLGLVILIFVSMNLVATILHLLEHV